MCRQVLIFWVRCRMSDGYMDCESSMDPIRELQRLRRCIQLYIVHCISFHITTSYYITLYFWIVAVIKINCEPFHVIELLELFCMQVYLLNSILYPNIVSLKFNQPVILTEYKWSIFTPTFMYSFVADPSMIAL